MSTEREEVLSMLDQMASKSMPGQGPFLAARAARIIRDGVSVETAYGEQCADVLRGLASYVGAGGYNALTVDPAVFDDKIRWGIDHLREIVINAPETADFMAGVPLEAAHQRERWGVDHDAGKSPFDWFWLIGYLAQKAADAAVRGDAEKAKHHTISTAAALANWHAALSGLDSRFQPGITPKPAEMIV